MQNSRDGLELRLLGSPQVMLAGVPVTGFITSKAEALLYYLAVTARPHTRSLLATLLWPDVPEPVARKNLRDIIFNLRKLLGDYLTITRQSLSFNHRATYWVDIVEFQRLVTPKFEQYDYQQLQLAIALYQGDLLDGFYIRDAESFDEWLTAEREQLRLAATHAIHQLVAYYLESSAWTEGLQLTQRLLAMEAWDEAAYRQQMRLLVASGQRGAALVQYERCCQVLQKEFGVEPSAETQALYQAIQIDDFHQSTHTTLTSVSPLGTNTDTFQGESATTHELLRRDLLVIPEPTYFIGRQRELELLEQAIIHNDQQLVAVVGLGGQGKTALVAYFITHYIQYAGPYFSNGAKGKKRRIPQRILWYSCQNASSLEDILIHWLQQLSIFHSSSRPIRVDQLITMLLDCLSNQTVLLVLDNFENFLSVEKKAGSYRQEFLDVELLLERLSSVSHQSTLIFTSREQPLTLARLIGNRTVTTIPVEGLFVENALQLLEQCQLQGPNQQRVTLIERYSGNPLALKIVAETINELFAGDLNSFLQEETIFVEDIRHVLDQQFARLSSIELDILLWVAIERESVTPQQIWDNLVHPPTRNHFYEALRSLQRRFLIEIDEHAKRFTGQLAAHLSMQTVIMEYVTEYFVTTLCTELVTETLDLFHRFLLIEAQAPDYIRQLQRRTLLQPLLRQLHSRWGQQGIEQHLQTLINGLKAQPEQLPGYGAANLLHLMIEWGIDLTGKDFSHLAIWQADLRRAILRQVNFAHTDLRNSAFADYFGGVTAVAFSPDNRLLAAGTTDGNVLLWRVSDGKLAGICRGNGRWIWAIAFSPDGQKMVTGYGDKMVRLWDISDIYTVETSHLLTALVQKTLEGHNDAIFSVAFSPDNQLIVSGGGDGTLCIWCAMDGTLLASFEGHPGGVLSLAFNPIAMDDDSGCWQLASGGRDGLVRLWSIPSTFPNPSHCAPALAHRILRGHTNEVMAVIFHPSGKNLLSGSNDCTVRLWSIEQGEVEYIFNDAPEPILAVACANDVVLAAGNDHVIYHWHLASGKLLSSLTGHNGAIGSLALMNDRAIVASGSFDQSIRIWDLQQGLSIRTYYSNRNSILATALHPTGQLFVNGGNDGSISSWRFYKQNMGNDTIVVQAPQIASEPKRRGNQQSGLIHALAFHPHEPYLASASEDGIIRFWAIEQGTVTYATKLDGDLGCLLSLAISPDGKWLAAGSTNAKILLYSYQSQRMVCHLETTSPLVEVLVFSPDSNCLYSSSERGEIAVWQLDQLSANEQQNTSKNRPHIVLKTQTNGITALAMHPNGRTLAVGGANSSVELWSLETDQCYQRYPTPSSTFALAFSPNGVHLAAGGGGKVITCWNLATDEASELEGHKGTVRQLCFTPNSEHLFSGGDDELVIVWQKQGDHWQRIARRHSPGPYDKLNIYGATGIHGEQQVTLTALGAVEQVSVVPVKRQQHNLPTPLTPLYGRESDIQALVELLVAPELRLITILGEGGVGKTRIALEVARRLPGFHIAHFENGSAAQAYRTHFQQEHQPFSPTYFPPRQPKAFQDGIWFISLAGIAAGPRSVDLLIADISNVLNITLNQQISLEKQLIEQLQDRSLLLILDNVEHLWHHISDYLSELLQTAPKIKILTTSRHHFDFFAQHVYRLSGLPVPTEKDEWLNQDALLQYPGIKLFVEQANRATGDFSLTPNNRSAVLWLCRFMNGLPLGIKLAAAQLVNYSLEELAARAQQDLSLLTSSAADLPKHQRSLQTLLHNMIDDLSPALAELLISCTVFDDSFSSDAAQFVVHASHPAQMKNLSDKHVQKSRFQFAESLDELANRSLFHPIEHKRFFIHEFVRTFVHAQQENQRTIMTARERHATYFAQLLDTIGRRRQSTAMDVQVLSKELVNLRSAWQWMVNQPRLELIQQSIEGLTYLHERLGQFGEAAHMLKEAISRLEHYCTQLTDKTAAVSVTYYSIEYTWEILADLHIYHATTMEMMGDLQATRQSAQIVVDYGQKLNQPRLEVHGTYLLALQAQQRGQLKIALEWIQRAAELATVHGLPTLQIMSSNLQGILHDMQGDHYMATACYRTVLPLAIETNDLFQERLLVNNLGIVALATGDWEDAKAYLERNLVLSEKAGNAAKQTYALMNHALYLNAVGLFEQARQELLQGLTLARAAQHRQSEVYILQFLALTDFYSGRSHSGIKYAEESLTLIETYQYLGLKAISLAFLGHNHLALDKIEEANHIYKEAIELWRAMNNQLEIGTTLIANGYVLLRLGRLEEALLFAEETIEMLDTILQNNAMEAMWVIIGCYFILQEANDERRHAILQKGYQQLLKQSETIQDPEIRKVFLNNIYPHRLIMRAMSTTIIPPQMDVRAVREQLHANGSQLPVKSKP